MEDKVIKNYNEDDAFYSGTDEDYEEFLKSVDGKINAGSPVVDDESADDLGATKIQTFRKVELPLSMPGVYSGIAMVFMPAVTTFVISKLLGGGQQMLIGNIIEKQFMEVSSTSSFGGALSLILIIVILVSMAISNKLNPDDNSSEGGGLI